MELPPKRKAWAPSWIYEAVMACARDAAAAPGNATRMILVFSDGFATTDTRPEEGAAVARELGIPVYPVALGHARITERAQQIQQNGRNRQGAMTDGARDRLARLQDKEREMEEFASLGELTGGRSFDPPLMSLTVVQQILTFMVAQVRCEYVVGFTPPPASGRPAKHKLEVRLRSQDLGKILGGVRVISH